MIVSAPSPLRSPRKNPGSIATDPLTRTGVTDCTRLALLTKTSMIAGGVPSWPEKSKEFDPNGAVSLTSKVRSAI